MRNFLVMSAVVAAVFGAASASEGSPGVAAQVGTATMPRLLHDSKEKRHGSFPADDFTATRFEGWLATNVGVWRSDIRLSDLPGGPKRPDVSLAGDLPGGPKRPDVSLAGDLPGGPKRPDVSLAGDLPGGPKRPDVSLAGDLPGGPKRPDVSLAGDLPGGPKRPDLLANDLPGGPKRPGVLFADHPSADRPRAQFARDLSLI